MTSREFLASFAVEIDEGGVTRLQTVPEENRAVPLLRQLLSELSPSARAGLSLGDGRGLAAGNAGSTSITQNNSNVSAPVTIQVRSSGTNPEQGERKLYDTAERYLLRTLQGAMGQKKNTAEAVRESGKESGKIHIG